MHSQGSNGDTKSQQSEGPVEALPSGTNPPGTHVEVSVWDAFVMCDQLVCVEEMSGN